MQREEIPYLHLLDLLTERGAIARSVFTGDADLLGAFGHFESCLVGCRDGEIGWFKGWGRR